MDVERARREIVVYYGDKKEIYDYEVVKLLNRYAGPSPVIARAVRGWLPAEDKSGDSWSATEMRILLLKSDPYGALEEVVDQIDRSIVRKKARHGRADSLKGDLDRLISAVIETNSDFAMQPLLRYVHDPMVSDLTKIEIMEFLAGRKYNHLPQIIAKWLDENTDIQSWLRSAAKEKWGEYGRQALAEADRLNMNH